MPDYHIGFKIFESITGGDQWARYALAHGIVRIQDIPKELMDADNHAKRTEWLANKISPEERKRIDDESNKFFESLGL